MSRRMALFVALALVGSAVLTGGCSAQYRSTGSGGVWMWENPLVAGNDLLGVDAVDDNLGWAVGKRGTIVKTINGGNTDSTVMPPPFPFVTTSFTKTRTEYSGTTSDLEDVSIADTETVWAVGRGGTILKTVNGGQTWLPQDSRTQSDLYAVDAVDTRRAVAVGYHGKILRTTDGASWTDLNRPAGQSLLDVDFVDGDLGFACGEGGLLLKTTDGGATWSSVADDLPGGGDVTSIAFASATVGWATTWDGIAGKVMLTENGGLHWVIADTAAPGTKMESVSCDGSDTAWAVGTGGYTYYTESRGAIPVKQALGGPSLRGTVFAGSTAWAVGNEGKVWAATGQSWTGKSVDAMQTDLLGYAPEAGWLVGENGKTFKPGNISPFSTELWTAVPFGTADVTAIEMYDSSTGWLAGADGTIGRVTGGTVSGTTNPTTARPTAISTVDGTHGWMTAIDGPSGVILETVNGTDWTQVHVANDRPLYGVAAQDTAVVAVGGYGALGRKTDTGWSFTEASHHETMRSVAGLGSNVFVAVGDDGKVMRTIDAGSTWTELDLGEADLFSVAFAGDRGLAVGREGAMFETTDGGITWEPRDSGTKRTLHTVGIGGMGTRAAGSQSVVLVELSAPQTLELHGSSRYDTCVSISKATFSPGGPRAVVVATGQNWPDAISGASLAGAAHGPMLLVTKDSLPATIAAEIERLQVSKAYILGSETVVSKAVADAVKAKLTGGKEVVRVAGAGRYETSAKIASATVDELEAQGGGWTQRVFLATGQNWPDALAASPVSANQYTPILLVPPTGVPQAISDVTTKLGVHSAVALGSGSVVPTSVVDQYDALISGTVDRWAGPSRYGTAAEVARRAVLDHSFPLNRVGLATGMNFPDALSGGAAIGQRNGLLLLSRPDYLSPEAGTFISEHRGYLNELQFYGGENVFGPRPRGETLFLLTSGYFSAP